MKKLLCLVLSMLLIVGNVGVIMATTEGIQQGDIMLLSNRENDTAIEVCMDLGLIEGYPDGTFKGENEITRAEMATIMTRLLGQANLVTSSKTPFSDVPANHWASGYVNVAYSNKVIVGDGNGTFRPEDPVSYQEAVKMIAAVLGYEPAANDKGGYPTGWLVVASENGLLEDTTNTGAAPASRATVAQLVFNALTADRMIQTGYGDNKEYTFTNGMVDNILTKYLKMSAVEVTLVANDHKAIEGSIAKVGYVKDSNGNSYLVGDSNASAKLGYLVTLYLKENKDEDAMEILSCVSDKSTTEVVLDIADIDVIEDDTIITYDEDEYEIPANTDINLDAEGTVTLLFHKNDDVAKYVFVKTYTTDIVEEVNTKAGKIYLKNSATIVLDEEDNDDLVYSIVLNNNKAITKLSDLKKGDIISWYSSNENHYEILVSRKTVEGSVSAIGKEDDKKVYTIDGDKYFGSVSAVSAKLPEVPGASGVFYLDAFGKIVTYDRVNYSATDKDYGYVIKAGVEETTFDEDTYLVKILTTEGKIKTYTIADKLYKNTVVVEKESDKLVVTDDDYIELTDIDELKELEGQVIEYGVNTNGKIVDIVVCGSGDYSLNVDVVLNRMDAPSAEYDKINNELGDFYVTKDTIVFITPDSAKDEDYAVTNISILEDEKIYNNVAFYAINDDKEAGVIVLTDAITTGNEKGNIALFVSTSTVKNDDNVTVSMIEFYENGEFVYAYCDSKEDYELTIGDIFTYTLNDKGEITDVDVQYSAEALQGGKSYTRPNTDEPTYVVGAVYGREDSVLKIGAIGAEKKTENHKISSDANIYMVDKTGSKIKVSVAELFDIVGNKYINDEFMEEEDTYFVVIKYVDKVATDVVVYKNFLN